MSCVDPPTEFDAEVDAIDRCERMVEKQVRTIESIGDEAAAVARLVGLLFGLVLTGLSVATNADGIGLGTVSVPLLLLAALGSGGLFLSVLFAVFTYLSSAFDTGPSRQLGTALVSHDVADSEYKAVVLWSYQDALASNQQVIAVNAQRFQLALVSLLCGLLYVSMAVVQFLSGVGSRVAYVLVACVTTLAAVVARHIIRGEYLTLEREVPHDE
jgi:hypothetical protein